MTELVIDNNKNSKKVSPMENQQEDYEKLPPITLFHKLTFALLGICSLTGWNAILNAFDFFQAKFPKKNFVDVAFYFPIPIMCTNFLVGICLTIVGNKIPIEKRIPFSLRGAVFTLVSICLVGIYLKYTQAGMALVFIILILQGTFDSLTTNSSIALSGATQSGELIGIFWTFTAWSGVIMNILRFIALGAFGIEDLDNGTGLYFGVATGFYIIGSICITIFTNCDYYKAVLRRDKMRNLKLQQQKQADSEKDMFKMQDNQIVINNENQQQTAQQLQTAQKILTNQQIQTANQFDVNNNQKTSNLNKVINFFIIIGPAPFFIFMTYVQTFMLFPGVSVFQKPKYTLIEFPYALVFMFTIYNIGDLVGKSLGSVSLFKKQWIAYIEVLSRFTFYIFFLLIAKKQGSLQMQNDVFQFFLLFMFALTNGMITSILMALAPQRATNAKDRDLICYMSAFSLNFGIAIGSFMALTLSNN
ncbi:nucleoside transporter family protein, putative [Ichthyophthirius multifiliis]|uniref:Nucleoside transporter family protein, putative n=1 Tax=Ichthyophthirius multifiliis TaxID=5932 RepID=G0QYF3_ICHMU|nr:nucleoside transporter family protein, putative [Ichthyophthirius multifiliis]EGR29762.1 nucleoside transporter family protein, putative [Ichthyophthirius multifiliis]|eukprot:XP_004030998.1 nucleoside transporter family protein, putative [Ichthyophthirius multifiliis]